MEHAHTGAYDCKTNCQCNSQRFKIELFQLFLSFILQENLPPLGRSLFSSKYTTCHSIIERFAGKDNDIFLKISGNTKQINPLWQNKWRISPVPPFFLSCLWDNFAYWRKISFHKNGWYSHRSSHIRKAIKAR